MTNRKRIQSLIDYYKRASELAEIAYEKSKDLSEGLCYMTETEKNEIIARNNDLITSLEEKLNSPLCSEEPEEQEVQEEQGAQLVQRMISGQR